MIIPGDYFLFIIGHNGVPSQGIHVRVQPEIILPPTPPNYQIDTIFNNLHYYGPVLGDDNWSPHAMTLIDGQFSFPSLSPLPSIVSFLYNTAREMEESTNR